MTFALLGFVMNNPHQTLFEVALALPEADRVLLVERLLESLSPEPDEMTDDEFFAELERRHAEFEQDPSVAIPWSEVLKED